MNDDHLTDEVLSAVLDGEATPTDARHAAGCEPCARRLAELRRAASFIGSPVEPSNPARRDAAIARALGARVVPLAPRRIPMGWLAGAAAALVALAIAVPLVRDTGNERDDMASKSAVPALRSNGSSTGAADSAAPAEAAAGAPAPVLLGDLGAVDAESLTARVRRVLQPPKAASTTSAAMAPNADDSACAETLVKGDPAFGVLRGSGRATVDGRAAIVLAFSVDDRIRVFAVSAGACDDILVSVTFPAA